MKTYTLDFVLKFAARVRDEQIKDLRWAIVKFEDEYNRRLPEGFELDRLIELACDEIGISTDEYHSQFKYGNIFIARHLVCYVLHYCNLKSGEISEMTGYSQPRVLNSISAIKKNYHKYERQVNNIILKLGI